MPLSPKYLLISEIGKVLPKYHKLDRKMIRFIRKIQVEKAYRNIFSQNKLIEIDRLRPSIVDPMKYQLEKEMWINWHRDHSTTE